MKFKLNYNFFLEFYSLNTSFFQKMRRGNPPREIFSIPPIGVSKFGSNFSKSSDLEFMRNAMGVAGDSAIPPTYLNNKNKSIYRREMSRNCHIYFLLLSANIMDKEYGLIAYSKE